jgi:hypothetical protein
VALNGAGFANSTELTRCRFNDTAEEGNLESKYMGYHNLYVECHGKMIYFFFFFFMAVNIFFF